MDDLLPEGFEIEIDPEEPVYIIGVVSDLVGLPIWTLRKLDCLGVVEARRRGKKTRCYSKKQIKKLKYVRYLMEEKHVNINGIKVILEIEEH